IKLKGLNISSRQVAQDRSLQSASCLMSKRIARVRALKGVQGFGSHTLVEAVHIHEDHQKEETDQNDTTGDFSYPEMNDTKSPEQRPNCIASATSKAAEKHYQHKIDR